MFSIDSVALSEESVVVAATVSKVSVASSVVVVVSSAVVLALLIFFEIVEALLNGSFDVVSGGSRGGVDGALSGTGGADTFPEWILLAFVAKDAVGLIL